MKFDFLKRICCPPEYLTLPRAGIEIGNKFIRFIEFKNKKGEIVLSNFGEVMLADDIVKDGQILNKEELIKVLKLVRGKISTDFVKVSIPEEKTYIFSTQIPKLKNNEIRPALEFKLEENVPLKVDEAVFEYEFAKKAREGSSDMVLGVFVVPKQVRDSYVEVIKSAGLNLISLEFESKMVAEAVVPKNYDTTVLVANIKHDSTVLSVVIDGVVHFSSTVSIGESNMMSSLKRMNKNNSTFEKIPLSFFDSNDDSGAEAFDSLLNVYSILKDEIEKFSEYWLTQVGDRAGHKSERPNKIIFCGRSSALPGLLIHINQNMGMDAVLANVWVNIIDINKTLPEIGFIDSLDYATAIGLAIPFKK